jgi:hypothetical protein
VGAGRAGCARDGRHRVNAVWAHFTFPTAGVLRQHHRPAAGRTGSRSLVPCNTPARIPRRGPRTCALGRASASDATGDRRLVPAPLSHRLALDGASEELGEWVVRDGQDACSGRGGDARLLRVHTSRLLCSIASPVILLSGIRARSPRRSSKALAEALPNGCLEVFTGHCPRSAHASLDFWAVAALRTSPALDVSARSF